MDSHYDTIGCVVACDHSFPISVCLSLLSFEKEEERKTPFLKLALWVQVMVIYAVQILYSLAFVMIRAL